MSESIVTCAAGKSRRTMSRCGRIWIWRRRRRLSTVIAREARPRSVLAALHPVLEHLQRHRTVVLGRLRDSLVVAFLDPGFVRRGAVTRQRQPHQPAGGLTRQLVAVEQHLAEQGLRLMLALLGGKAEPARTIAGILPRGADGAPQVEPGQLVLR